jgi:hypothetical protein
MNVDLHFIFYLTLSLSILFVISFSYGVIIKKYARFNITFYFPLGFLVFLGLSYFLSFPFVYFKWSSKIYYIMLASISLIAFFHSCLIIFRDQLYKNISTRKIMFSLVGIGFIVFAFYQTTKYSVAPNAFDTVYYNSFVISNINKPYLGWWYAMDNIPLNFVQTQYDFSSYYYIHSFTSIILKTLFSDLNELFYAPLFMWQGTISLIALMYFSCVNCFDSLFNGKKYIWLVPVFSIICLFYGSMYFNNALAFIGNSYRPYIVSSIFLVIHFIFEQKERNAASMAVLTLLNAALISVSSSGFFISSFIMFGLFSAYLKKYGIYAFRIVGIIALPTILFLFAFVLDKSTLILSPIFFLFLYSIPYIRFLNNPNFLRKFEKLIIFVVPSVIVLSTVVFPQIFQYDYSYFFYHGGSSDMVWDYFYFGTFLITLINVSLITLISFVILSKNNNEHPIPSIIRSVFITFLNPLVIPFTVKFLTDFVFYRAFDVFFNPFIISYALYLIYDFLKEKQRILQPIVACTIALPFLLFGLYNFTQYYHFFFEQPEDYNYLLKQTNAEFDVLSKLNEIIESNQDTRPIVASQIIQTLGFVPNTNMPYSLNNALTRKSEYLNQDQADLLNIMIYSPETISFNGVIDGKEPEIEKVVELMISCNVKYAVINKNSYYYYQETDSYIYLFSILYEEFDVLYANDQYVIFEITH